MKFKTLYRDNIPLSQGGIVAGVSITLDDEVLNFSLGKAGRRNYVEPDKLFNAVNALIRNLTKDQQIELFGAYARAEQFYNINLSIADTTEGLKDICDTIFSVLPPEGVEAWGKNSYPNFEVPDTIVDERKEGNYPKHSSYDKTKYRALCALSTLFKLLLPVLFRFMDIYRNVVGVHMKEYTLFSLLDEEELLKADAYRKLLDYTKGVVEDKNGGAKVPMGLLTDGVSAEEYPRFILASKLIRDLALSETDVADRGESLNNVAAKITRGISISHDQTFRVYGHMDKTSPKKKLGGEDGNTTLREDIQGSEVYSRLYPAAYNNELSRSNLYIKLGIEDELHQVFEDANNRYKPTLDERKQTLTFVLLSHQFDAEGIAIASKTNRRKAMVLAAAMAHQYGLVNITAFLMSNAESLGDVVSADTFTGINAKPDPDLLKEARALYPQSNDGYHYVDRHIDDLIKSIAKNSWVMTLPDSLHQSYGVNKRYIPGKEFKNEILRLLIKQNEKWVTAKQNTRNIVS